MVPLCTYVQSLTIILSCPYVTAVGATKIPEGGSVSGGEVVANDPAGDPYPSPFASGGGFSNIFSIPDYQADAVSKFVPFPSFL